MLTKKITDREIEFMELWQTPRCLAECLFPDFDNFGRFETNKKDSIRLYQFPMLSNESLIDFKATAKHHGFSKKEEFKLRKNVADVYNLGARLYGKTLISLTIDIALSALYEKGLKSAFWSIDEKRIRGVLSRVEQAMKYHPIYKIFKFVCRYKPEIRFYGKKNYWELKGINIKLQGKNPGDQFYQLHVAKMWGDEVSFETETVFKKRRDSGSELGVINRQGGMTNFTRHSPAGKSFYDPKNKNKVINLPRYCNPFWSKEDLEDALIEFGGEATPNFRVFVGGEVIEDGISEIDMDRVKDCYQPKKRIKRFELKKEQFKNFEHLIVVERPKNAERIFISADVGDRGGGTDITIFSEVGNKYNYLYNIILYSFKEKEQLEVFKWLIEKLEANIIAIDCGDHLGRGLCDSFEDLYGKEHVVRYAGASKINVLLAKDEKGNAIFKNGEPVYRQEYMSVWSVARLKILLYETRINIPIDYKLDDQLNNVISTKGKTSRATYPCIAESGDHLYSSFRVFSIAQWLKKDFNQTPEMKQDMGIGVSSWISKEKEIENKEEILNTVHNGRLINCSKEEFESGIRQLLNDRGSWYIANGDTVRAKFISTELKRLEQKLQGEK